MSELLKLSEASWLALHTMAILAITPDLYCTRKIADILNASPHHLSKVMQRLVKVGLVESIRGPRGGFKLKREANQINLMEIYEIIEGPISSTDCGLCNGSCIIAELMNKIENDFITTMKNTTLQEYGESILKNLKVKL